MWPKMDRSLTQTRTGTFIPRWTGTSGCWGQMFWGAGVWSRCLPDLLGNWAVLHVQQIRIDTARIFINASSENMTSNRKLVNHFLTQCKVLSTQSTHFRSLLTSWKWSRNIFAKISGLQNPSCCWNSVCLDYATEGQWMIHSCSLRKNNPY